LLASRSASFCFFSPPPRAHRHLHSFPTRRSSDLACDPTGRVNASSAVWGIILGGGTNFIPPLQMAGQLFGAESTRKKVVVFFTRSEEHTSELQSRRDLVCRLLLEKKKHKIKQ